MPKTLNSSKDLPALERAYHDQQGVAEMFEYLCQDEALPERCYGLLSAKLAMNRTIRDIRRTLGMPVHNSYKPLPWLVSQAEEEGTRSDDRRTEPSLH